MSDWLDALEPHVPAEILDQARAFAEQGGDGAEYLLRGGYLSPGRLLAALSRHHDLPALMLATYHPEAAALARVPEDVARRFSLLPLFIHKDRIFVAVSTPGNLDVEDFIRQKTGLSMEPVVALSGDLARAINRFYLTGAQTAEKVRTLASRQGEEAPRPEPEAKAPVTVEDEEAPSIRMVNHILSTGIRLGASDIHLEPFEESASLRYRLDGVLREHSAPPLDLLRAVTSRIKILAEMDVSERRLPQDGRITTTVDGQDYDLRVSIIPNLYG